VARNKNCPGERAIIEVMAHEVIYPLTIPYGPVKGKVINRIPHCPKIEEGNISKTIYKQIINILSIECPIR
jgi:hypothetical protein